MDINKHFFLREIGVQGGGGGGVPKPPAVEKYYLLGAGIDEYGANSGLLSLHNCVRDVTAVVDVLTTVYSFEKPQPNRIVQGRLQMSVGLQTICLYNGEATKDNLFDAVAYFAHVMGPNDALLFYFAGHGVLGSNGLYYLIPSGGEKGRYSSYSLLSELYAFFREYRRQRTCRDLLMILDCCYAGASFGGVATQVPGGLFSRSLVTSCLADQPAADGQWGRGSAFANSLVEVLKENQETELVFKQMVSPLKSKFALNEDDKWDERQVIEAALIPDSETGTGGDFIFAKRDKFRPDIQHLIESFIDHLDFLEQRSDLTKFYKRSLDSMVIVTTQGPTLNVQRVLSKIIFRWMKSPSRFNFDPSLCYMSIPLMIDKCEDTDIWRALYRQLKDDSSSLRDENESILDWYFEKLIDYDGASGGNRHVILPIAFSLGGTQVFDMIKKFCEDFSRLFVARRAGLDELQRKNLGKMIVVVSDERGNGGGEHKDLLKSLLESTTFNFIPTQQIGSINENHATDWIEVFRGSNLSERIQQLGNRQHVDDWMKRVNLPSRYEDFVVMVCDYCELSSMQRLELHKDLYDFSKKSLIG